jgi:biotin carboxylase
MVLVLMIHHIDFGVDMMSKRSYFIIGGGTLQYNFVLKVKEMGFISHVFDYDPYCRCAAIADCFHLISIDEKEKILEMAKKYRPIAVQTVATELGNITACYIGERMGLYSNSYETALNTTDKSRMKRIFNANNIPNARYFEANSIENIDFKSMQFPVVVKPSDRSAGRGVVMVKDRHEFGIFFEKAMAESINKSVLIEEVMQGSQFSVETITYNGNHTIIAFTEEYFENGENVEGFVESHQIVPARIKNSEKSELSKLIVMVLDAFGIKYGASHIEVKLTDQGFKVIELASRMGGWRDMLINIAFGIDYNELLIQSTIGNIPKIDYLFSNYALVKMIFKKSEYIFYSDIKKNNPQLIVYDEVHNYHDAGITSLIDAGGFYYLRLSSKDIDYYTKAVLGEICSSD